ncbi:hypothetical protein ACFQZC_27625 [Streptacidiphilus monticola]
MLICRHEGERHDLLVRGTGGDADLAAGTLHRAGLRLLPLPASAPGGPVAVALGTDGPGATAVWLVSADGVAAPQQVTALPGRYGGGVWLDRGGRLLALDQLRTDAGAAGGRVKTVVLDLATGRLTQLLELTPESNDRLVAADPLSGLIIVRSDAPGEDRLGWGCSARPHRCGSRTACTTGAASCVRWPSSPIPIRRRRSRPRSCALRCRATGGRIVAGGLDAGVGSAGAAGDTGGSPGRGGPLVVGRAADAVLGARPADGPGHGGRGRAAGAGGPAHAAARAAAIGPAPGGSAGCAACCG